MDEIISNKRLLKIFFVTLCVSIGIVIKNYYFEDLGYTNKNYLYGALTGQAVLAFFIVYMLALRRIPQKIQLFVLVILLTTSFVSGIIINEYKLSKLANLKKQLIEDISEINEKSDKEIDKILSKYDSSEDDQVLRLIMNKYFQNQANLSVEYMKELDEIGFFKLLTPEHFNNYDPYNDAENIIHSAKISANNCREYSIKLIHDLRIKVLDSGVNADMIAGFTDVYDANLENNIQTINLHWDYEIQIFSTFSDIFNLLKEQDGEWGFDNGQFFFTDTDAVSRFNGYLGKIDELTSLQEQIQDSNLKDFNALKEKTERD